MIIRQLESVQYDLLCHDLSANAYSLPLDPSYMVSLFLDSAEYMVKLQPEDNNRIAVLHALGVDREEEGPFFFLITEDHALHTFLDAILQPYGVC